MAASIPTPERSNRSSSARCAAPNNCRTSIWTRPTVPTTRAAWSSRKNLPLNPSCGSPACAISPRCPPCREKSSLIHDDQGCFSEIHQSFFFGDGLGFLGLHVGDDREQHEATFLSRYDEVLRKARAVGILTGGKSPEHDVAIDQLAGATGSKLAFAVPGVGRDHGGGDIETFDAIHGRDYSDEANRLVGLPCRAVGGNGNRRFGPAQDSRVMQRGLENEIRRQLDGFDLHFRRSVLRRVRPEASSHRRRRCRYRLRSKPDGEITGVGDALLLNERDTIRQCRQQQGGPIQLELEQLPLRKGRCRNSLPLRNARTYRSGRW